MRAACLLAFSKPFLVAHCHIHPHTYFFLLASPTSWRHLALDWLLWPFQYLETHVSAAAAEPAQRVHGWQIDSDSPGRQRQRLVQARSTKWCTCTRGEAASWVSLVWPRKSWVSCKLESHDGHFKIKLAHVYLTFLALHLASHSLLTC